MEQSESNNDSTDGIFKQCKLNLETLIKYKTFKTLC